MLVIERWAVTKLVDVRDTGTLGDYAELAGDLQAALGRLREVDRRDRSVPVSAG